MCILKFMYVNNLLSRVYTLYSICISGPKGVLHSSSSRALSLFRHFRPNYEIRKDILSVTRPFLRKDVDCICECFG
jgi:hypothetical protein